MQSIPSRLFPLLITAGLAIPGLAVADWHLEPLASEWYFAGFENSLDISGTAIGIHGHCLVASDESFYVQPGRITTGEPRIESRRPIALPAGTTGAELDIEGLAFSPDATAYYAVGSHGVGKKKTDIQPDRQSVFFLPVDPETGHVIEGEVRRTSLSAWIEKTPLLAPYLHQPLQVDGLNIEGIACSGNTLFFGLRSPEIDGHAIIIEIPSEKLFHDSPEPLVLHRLPLGTGRGIREIAAIRDGILILAGNSAAEATKKVPRSLAPGPDKRFELFHWDRSTPPSPIGALPPNDGKAEALLVLHDAATHIDLLIAFDGLPGGLPISVRVHR